MTGHARGIIGILPVKVPSSLQVFHADGGVGQENAQTAGYHCTTGIIRHRTEIIEFFQIGDGDGGGEGACCLIGGNGDLVVPGSGGGDCGASVLIAPAYLHRWVLPAGAGELTAEDGCAPAGLGAAHRPESGWDDRLCKKGAVKQCVRA